MGVKLELVPVVSSNRIEFLQQGKIDIVIATMSDTPARRKVVQAIDPPYYSDFVNVLLPKKAGIKDWSELKGKTALCTSRCLVQQGDRQDLRSCRIVALMDPRSRCFALKQGNCVGYVYDQTFVQGKLLDAEWSERLRDAAEGRAGRAVDYGGCSRQRHLQKFLEDTTKDWMRPASSSPKRRSTASSRPITRRACMKDEERDQLMAHAADLPSGRPRPFPTF